MLKKTATRHSTWTNQSTFAGFLSSNTSIGAATNQRAIMQQLAHRFNIASQAGENHE